MFERRHCIDDEQHLPAVKHEPRTKPIRRSRPEPLEGSNTIAPTVGAKEQVEARRAAATSTDSSLRNSRKQLIAFIERAPPKQVEQILQAVKSVITKPKKRHCATLAKVAVRQSMPGKMPKLAKAQSGKKKPPRPPDGFSWPTTKYSEYSLTHRGDVVAFLSDKRIGWSRLLEAGVAELRALRLVDPSLKNAIDNYVRPHPVTGERRDLPSNLHFLTRKEANNRNLREIVPEIDALRDHKHLLNLVTNRLKRGAALL